MIEKIKINFEKLEESINSVFLNIDVPAPKEVQDICNRINKALDTLFVAIDDIKIINFDKK